MEEKSASHTLRDRYFTDDESRAVLDQVRLEPESVTFRANAEAREHDEAVVRAHAPTSDWVLAGLLAEQLQRESGLVLPQSRAMRNQTDADVLAVGPGKLFGSGIRSTMFAAPGVRAVFLPHHFHALDDNKRYGFVRDRAIVCFIHADGRIEPANDWLLLEPGPVEAKAGLLEIPDAWRVRQPWGKLLAWGPGAVRLTGDLAGTRRDPYWDLAWTSGCDGPAFGLDRLKGETVWYHEERGPMKGMPHHERDVTETVELSGENDEWNRILVRASDLACVLMEDYVANSADYPLLVEETG